MIVQDNVQDTVRQLLQRLTQDDTFRAQVQSDPIKALNTYGIKVDASTVPSKVQLPPKEDIANNIHVLDGQHETRSGWIVFAR